MANEFVDATLMDGFADGPHITEVQTGLANQGLYGPEDYVLESGRKAEAQVLTNNSIRIFDAVFVIQGRRDVIAANNYADVSIDNGAQGMNRNDIIVRRYVKDESTEIEHTEYAVIKGTAVSGEASDPDVTVGDIRSGATLHEMKLYRVKLQGLNIVAVEPLFKVLLNMSTINDSLSELNGKLSIESDSGHCIKFPDGMMIQWGMGSTSNYNAYREVSLYEPFVDTTYSVSIEFLRNGNTVDKYLIGDAGGNDTRRVNGFDLYLRRSTGTQYAVVFSYIAIGRWK